MGAVPATEAANHPVQRMAADIINRATIRLARRLKKEGLYRNGIWIILQIHDALYLETYEEHAEYAAQVLTECMECEYEVYSELTKKTHKMFFAVDKAKITDNVKDAA